MVICLENLTVDFLAIEASALELNLTAASFFNTGTDLIAIAIFKIMYKNQIVNLYRKTKENKLYFLCGFLNTFEKLSLKNTKISLFLSLLYGFVD